MFDVLAQGGRVRSPRASKEVVFVDLTAAPESDAATPMRGAVCVDPATERCPPPSHPPNTRAPHTPYPHTPLPTPHTPLPTSHTVLPTSHTPHLTAPPPSLYTPAARRGP